MKMHAGIILLVLVGIATAVPLNSDGEVNLKLIIDTLDNAKEGEDFGIIETIIVSALEVLRNLMVNGSDNIPVLDPLSIDRIHVDEELSIPNAHITIENMTMSGVSTFVVDEMKFSLDSFWLQRYRLAFDIMIPTVNVNTDSYDLSLPIFGGLVFGKGDMVLQIVKPRVKGHVILGFRVENGFYLVLHNCNINIGLDTFQPRITGMFGNEVTSDFVSAFLKNLIEEMLVFFEVEITNIVSSAVLTIGNSILGELDIGSLLPFPSAKQ